MTRKVTIEITPEGWTTKLQLGEKTFTESHKSTRLGAAKVEGDDFELAPEISDSLWEELTSFAQYGIMEALRDNSVKR